ncbi:hypothetical protein TrCOL_g11761 [Triparma columacea]|uniref:Uncharacterized protein n=1 Tax=Triparma columacea TaxID=722753 RepID=A0A9W7G214_9STRA|nr:hypothetical protein TrCOL_g11761 [Triparma columacea]
MSGTARSILVLDESFSEACARLNDFAGKEVLAQGEHQTYLRRRRELLEGRELLETIRGGGGDEGLKVYLERRKMLLSGMFDSLCAKAEEAQLSSLASASMRRAVTAERQIKKDPRFLNVGSRVKDGEGDKKSKMELRLLHLKHLDGVSCLALSNLSAGFIAIGHSSGLITIMDILTGSILSRAEAHSGKVTSVQVSSHNNFIATTAEDGTCRVWIVGANLARGGGRADEEGGGLKLCSQVAFRGRIVGCLMLPPRSSVGMSNEFENFLVVAENDERGKFGGGGLIHVVDCLRGGIRQTLPIGSGGGIVGGSMRAVGKKVGKMKVGGMTFDAVGGVLYASLSGGRLDAWKVDRGAWVGWEGEGGGKFLKGRWTVGKGKGWKELTELKYRLFDPSTRFPSLVGVSTSHSLHFITLLPPTSAASRLKKAVVSSSPSDLGSGGASGGERGKWEEEWMDNVERNLGNCIALSGATGGVARGERDGRVSVYGRGGAQGDGEDWICLCRSRKGMHGGEVVGVGWSRDERWVVSGDDEGDVCVWEVSWGGGGDEEERNVKKKGKGGGEKKGGEVIRGWE